MFFCSSFFVFSFSLCSLDLLKCCVSTKTMCDDDQLIINNQPTNQPHNVLKLCWITTVLVLVVREAVGSLQKLARRYSSISQQSQNAAAHSDSPVKWVSERRPSIHREGLATHIHPHHYHHHQHYPAPQLTSPHRLSQSGDAIATSSVNPIQ